jgi:hypothetical protein
MTGKELLAAMEGHILDQGELMATYSHARALMASSNPPVPPAETLAEEPHRSFLLTRRPES